MLPEFPTSKYVSRIWIDEIFPEALTNKYGHIEEMIQEVPLSW